MAKTTSLRIDTDLKSWYEKKAKKISTKKIIIKPHALMIDALKQYANEWK